MSIFDIANSGTKIKKHRYELKPRKTFDCRFGEMIPAFTDIVCPGDILKITSNLFIRFQPMLSPSLTRCWARLRYFFVPLRLVEPNTELIITGSKNGKMVNETIPVFDSIFDKVKSGVDKVIEKHSVGDYFGFPIMNYNSCYQDKTIPAAYWSKGFWRCWFDYYRDENLNEIDDFDEYMNTVLSENYIGKADSVPFVNLKKDYFVSCLPWQLKGITPTFSLTSVADFTNSVAVGQSMANDNFLGLTLDAKLATRSVTEASGNNLIAALNKVVINGGDFDMSDIRTMAAQTRLFERLARCGSRYTEYLKANFGISPSDGTLQRAMYLGGQVQPIVMTEVVQTGQDSSHPVGTLRGHGISNDVGKIAPFVAKEFGMVFGIFDIMPEIQYTQGIDRKFTYKGRFDFPNPSFQHLSEQEVRNGEIFMSADDGKNDETFGFQIIYNELRSSRSIVCGDMRDNLSYWTQAVKYNQRPNLNEEFINSKNYLSNFNQCFSVSGSDARPVIVDFGANVDKYTFLDDGTPGLVDHL